MLAAPIDGFDTAFAERVGSHRAWLPPLRNLLRWTFQTMYGVQTDDLNLSRFARTLQSRPVLMTDGRYGLMESTSIRGVKQFLQKHIGDKPGSATASLPTK